MAIFNNLPHPSTEFRSVIVKDGVLVQKNNFNPMGLTMENEDSAMTLTATANTSNCGYIRVPIYATPYNTLTIEISGKSGYKNNVYPMIGVSSWPVYAESDSSFQNLGTSTMLATSTAAFDHQIITLDISSETGIRFINFTMGLKSAGSYITIHNLYLS